MARLSDPKKLALWQGRFRRFLDSGLAVARFCAVEQVSASSFYYWQKKLGRQTMHRLARARDHDTLAEDRNTRAKDRSYAEDRDARAENHDAGAEDHDICTERRGIFRPVVVAPATCGVVVRLPGGARIEVDANHLDAIRAVVAETVRVDHGWTADRNVSSGNRSLSSDNRNVSSDSQAIRKRGGVSC